MTSRTCKKVNFEYFRDFLKQLNWSPNTNLTLLKAIGFSSVDEFRLDSIESYHREVVLMNKVVLILSLKKKSYLLVLHSVTFYLFLFDTHVYMLTLSC